MTVELGPDGKERVHAETVEEWRAWLTEHHADSRGAWLVSWRAHTGKPRITYEESVVEALAVGWVDSKGSKLDEDRTMLWFTRRKPTSAWARTNKQRVELLLAEGRMLPAGQAAIDVAKANGAWSLLDEVEDLIIPADLATAFDQHPGSREHWDGFPRSTRRALLEWIVLAKRPETRAKRIREIAERAARGERANQGPR